MDRTRDRPAIDAEPDEGPSAPVRKAWHAPQFMLTEIAQSELMSGGDTDPSSFGS